MPFPIKRTHTTLDRAYTEVSALGGWSDPRDPVATARAEMLDEVIAILERFGARDTRLPDAFYAGQPSEAEAA